MTAGRYIQLYQDKQAQWRWRVIGANHDDVIADSGEGYVHRRDALAMAADLHPSLPIETSSGGDEPQE